jgi:S1-C subfamily serine protease
VAIAAKETWDEWEFSWLTPYPSKLFAKILREDAMTGWSEPYEPPRPSPLLPFLLTAILVLAGLLLWSWWKRPTDPRDTTVDARAITARGSLAEDELSTIGIFQEASPCVVHVANVAVRQSPYSYNSSQFEQGTGTGIIWNREGFIVTNYHVVKGGQRFIVTLFDQTQFEAVVVGGSRAHDLAVLRIDGPPDRLKPIAIGTSGDLKVGQKVYAIGNPFGLDQTLSTGVVSQLNRVITTSEQIPIRGVIQTDAAINPGNSGGPLLDSGAALRALERLVAAGGGLPAPVLAERVEAWRRAYLNTPHGRPVQLSAGLAD